MSNFESSRTEGTDSIIPMSDVPDSDSFIQSSYAEDSAYTYSTTGIDDSSVIDSTHITDSNYHAEEPPKKTQNVSSKDNRTNTTTPFYQRRRFWAMCLAITVVLAAIFIPLLFLVIIPSTAQNAVKKSKIDFDAINITNPTNTSFDTNMLGAASGTGPFKAKISFTGPLEIFYNNNELGSVELESFDVSQGKGTVIGKDKTFTISNKPSFNEFTSNVLKVKSFVWTLKGTASVRALGMNINNIKVNKDITIPGSNGFITNLLDLNITENPDKSLNIIALTSIYNPSPIGIEVGDITIQLQYNQTIISTTTAKDVFLGTKETKMSMAGVVTTPTSDNDRINFIKIVNSYLTNKPINTTAKILSILPKNGPVDWLNAAVENLPLTAVIGNQTNPPKIITGIDFGNIDLKFSADDPYSPTISSTNTTATFTLPFNINFKILSVGQKLTMYSKDKAIATIETPEGTVDSSATAISMNIPETKIQVLDKDAFSDLLVALTTTKGTDIVVAGSTDIHVTTDILGESPIQGLPFNLTTNIQGFNQFNDDGQPPVINNINILAGTSDQLIMNLNVNLTNPSKYSTSIGKVKFYMYYKDQKIGSAETILSVAPGVNPLEVIATLDDPENNIGKEILTSFIAGEEITVNIKGGDDSTNITSLVPAFKAINIQSVIPPTKLPLFGGTKIQINQQTATTNISTGIVQLQNPFQAPISIYTMNSSVTFGGNVLGTLEQDIRDNPIFIPGNTVKTLQLPVKMNVDPVTTFSMVRNLALQAHLDVTVFDSLCGLMKIDVPGADLNAKPTPEAVQSFDLAKFITTALAVIPTTLNLNAQVAIGYYPMTIELKQDIYTETDNSVVQMIPALAIPLVSDTMQQSQMNIDSIFIQNIDVNSFDTAVIGTISNSGPIPSTVNFPNGVQVSSENVLLGTSFIPNITSDPLAGDTKLNYVGKFVIADTSAFAAYGEKLFAGDSASTDLSADNVMVTAFGLSIGPISFKKSSSYTGFSGMKQFSMDGFSLTPELTIAASVTNPSNIGAELGKVVFNILVGNSTLSTVTGDNVIIAPKNVSHITLHGSINVADPSLLSIFSSSPPPVTVQGVSITPPKATGEVEWLTSTFKSLSLPIDPKLLFSALTQNPAQPQNPAIPQNPTPPQT
ncbi:hypothetical protein C1645_881606 [Glomus cerebriforme]|uniref:Tag1-like fourth Ig-like domain-containing protein n=1 Tax=Glomus cerebriforme TaxID=658196 RepID=A0A397SAZ9_9GLOM|nr:hypothetical protein C1645_881606 [Glomus cerebriforme]